LNSIQKEEIKKYCVVNKISLLNYKIGFPGYGPLPIVEDSSGRGLLAQFPHSLGLELTACSES